MTEQNLTEHEVNTRHHVYRIMDTHETRAFEELDHLHKRGIHDTEVIKALRDGGYESEARAYIEWSGAQDPDLADVNNVTMNPDGVTDPGDNESNRQMQAAYEKLRDASILEGHPFEVFHDGDGMTEPFMEAYICGAVDCRTEYDLWRQTDPTCSGLSEFLSDERRTAAWEKHAAHLAQALRDEGAK